MSIESTDKPPRRTLKDLKVEAEAIQAILQKPWWDVEDVSIYMRRSPYYVKRLFFKEIIKRNTQNLTKREWVDEYLNRSVKGRIRSPVRPTGKS